MGAAAARVAVRPARVTFDARSARSPRHSGWERYARGLLDGLLQHGDADLLITPAGTGQSIAGRLWDSYTVLPQQARRADLCHFPTFPPVGWERGPMVYTLHDLTWWRDPAAASRLGRHLYRGQAERALRRAHILTPSESVAAEVRAEFGVPDDRVTAVRNAVALPQPEPPRRRPTRPYLLTVGTVEPRKNLRRLAAAWQRSGLATTHDLRLVGRQGWGDLPDGMRADIIDDDAHLAWLYRHAVATVMVSTYEGFGFPAAESLSQGTPVIASDIPALHEATLGCAVFVDPCDVDAIAAGLHAVADQPPVVPPAISGAITAHTWRDVAAAVADLYRRVLG